MKKMPILSIIVFVCALLLNSQQSFALPIYNSATDHWYDVVSGNWTESETASQVLGGHLVTINDQDEQTWLLQNFGSTPRYWIGFNDIATEGTFVWSSGEPVTYTNWPAGEPSNSQGSEHYVAMNWGPNGAWNDFPNFSHESWNNYSGIAEYSGATPEPSTMLLFGIGGIAAGLIKRKKCRTKSLKA